MAIQQVGGQGVYVITGSGRDPRKTSSGQSWANLVTQQKFMLIQEAQKEALRQIEQEQLSFEDKRKAQEQLRQQLLDQIAAEKKGIADLRVKQITTNEARTLANQRQGAKAPSGGGSVTESIPSEKDVQSFYTREINSATAQERKARSTKDDLIAAKDNLRTYKQAAPGLLSPEDLENYGTYEEAIDAMATREGEARLRAGELTTAKKDFTRASEPAKRKIQRQMSTKTIRYGTSQPGKKVEPLGEFKGFEPEIAGREDRIAKLQAELDALEVLERPTFDTIERTRQIYGDKFMGPRRRLRGPQTTETQPVEQPERTPEQESNLQQMESYGTSSDPMMIGGADTRPMIRQQPAEQPSRQLPNQQQPTMSAPVDIFEGEEEVIQPAQTRPNQGNMDALRQAEMDAINAQDFQFQPSTVQNLSTPRFDPLRPPAQPVNTFEGEPPVIDTPMRPMDFNFAPSAVQNLSAQPSYLMPQEGQRFLENMLLDIETPEQQLAYDYAQKFMDVQYGTPQQKQMQAITLLAEAAERHGPTSPEFKKEKGKILMELLKVSDPKQFRLKRQVERIMEEDPKNYQALTKAVSGITEADAKLVTQLFAPSGDKVALDVDAEYQNAKAQLQTLPPARRKKALELLELQYIAVLENINSGI